MLVEFIVISALILCLAVLVSPLFFSKVEGLNTFHATTTIEEILDEGKTNDD